MGCRNYLNGPLVGTDRQQLKQELKAEGNHKEYVSGRDSYEAVFNESEGRQAKSSGGRILRPKFLCLVEEDGNLRTRLAPIWWPESLLIEEKNRMV